MKLTASTVFRARCDAVQRQLQSGSDLKSCVWAFREVTIGVAEHLEGSRFKTLDGASTIQETVDTLLMLYSVILAAADGDVSAHDLSTLGDYFEVFRCSPDKARNALQTVLTSDTMELLESYALGSTGIYALHHDLEFGTDHSDVLASSFMGALSTIGILLSSGEPHPNQKKLLGMIQGRIDAMAAKIRGGRNIGEEASHTDDDDDASRRAGPFSRNEASRVASEPASRSALEQESLENLLLQLDTLVGLPGVKRQVRDLANLVKYQQLRVRQGLRTPAISHHLVFTGNPGTGKTTVARLIAKLYKSLGLLTSGHLVEVDRSGLVAGFVGQTALKTHEVASRALGGVLFVDEAYALAPAGSQGDSGYGREAIDTLLKLMEDHRDDFVVIVAGYPEEMERFLGSNPGLRSRFTHKLQFEDYSGSELAAIFDLLCSSSEYSLSEDARSCVASFMEHLTTTKEQGFGNARAVRNLFEQVVSLHANRIVNMERFDAEAMSRFGVTDLPEDVRLCLGAKPPTSSGAER